MISPVFREESVCVEKIFSCMQYELNDYAYITHVEYYATKKIKNSRVRN